MTATIDKTRPDGTRVRITATLWIESFGRGNHWSIEVSVCQPKKRSFFGVYSGDDHSFRSLRGPDRERFVLEKQLAVCTLDEMLEAKIKLWESLKPKL